MNNNLASLVSREDLGQLYHPFQPTYGYAGEYVDATHAALAEPADQQTLVEYQGIDGFLRVADALKLYELAFFATGDVLEIGTHHGLSTAILSTAIRNSQHPDRMVHTIEISPTSVERARSHHKRLNVEDTIYYHAQPSTSALSEFSATRQKFSLVFVDHDHSYAATLELLDSIEVLLEPRSLVLFHDYNDSRNTNSDDLEYGVFDAIEHSAPPSLKPFGTFGCCGLFLYDSSESENYLS